MNEELKKVLQNKHMDNLAPRPFGGTPFKSKKPSSVNGAVAVSPKPMGISLTSNDLSKGRLKHRNVEQNKVGDGMPEFLTRKLKTPEERKVETERKTNAQATINNALSSFKGDMTPKQHCKPLVPARKTFQDDNNNVNQDKAFTEEIQKERSHSIKDSVNFFQDNDRRASASLKIHPKPAPKPKPGSTPPPNACLLKENVPRKPEKSQLRNKLPQNTPNKTVEQSIPDEDDTYDDVTTATAKSDSTSDVNLNLKMNKSYNSTPDLKCKPIDNAISMSQTPVVEDDIYDDVSEIEVRPPSIPQIHNETSRGDTFTPDDGYVVEDDIYDDISEIEIPSPLPLLPNETSTSDNTTPDDVPVIEEDFYDDVSGIELPPTLSLLIQNETNRGNTTTPDDTPVIEDDFYDDISELRTSHGDIYDDVENTTSLQASQTDKNMIPIKFPKTFKTVEPNRLLPPFGLEKWLMDILDKNKSNLKDIVNLQFNQAPQIKRDTKAVVESIQTGNEVVVEEEQDFYDNIEQSIPVDSGKPDPKSEKEKKKKDKKEKAEKAEQERKEKDEKKRRKKEFKYFQLNPDEPLIFLGSVSCCADFKPKDKSDIAYKIGDEINIIDYPANKCPPGKMLIENNGRIGYVLRKDFGMEETPTVTETDEDMRPRTVSLIPTEDDDLQETYEVIGTYQAPPVPETPRPMLHPEVGVEEFYNVVSDEQEDQIYEVL